MVDDVVASARGPIKALAHAVAELRERVAQVPTVKYGTCEAIAAADALATVSLPSMTAAGVATAVMIPNVRCIGALPSPGDAVALIDSGRGRLVVIGVQNVLRDPYVLATGGVSDVYGANTNQVLMFATEVHNRDGGYDVGSGTYTALRSGLYDSRFTIKAPVAATYQVRVRAQWGGFIPTVTNIGSFRPDALATLEDPIVEFGFRCPLSSGETFRAVVNLSAGATVALGNTFTISRVGS